MDDDVSRLRHAADVRYAVDRVNNDAIFRAGSEPRQRHSTQTDQDQDHTHTDRQTDRQTGSLLLHTHHIRYSCHGKHTEFIM